eukprot:TRINITY_DN14752_c1_g2_i1.p1 TRINITY_DN14752_c1_g2~~TRINITY_DN14752_c1_g2_i1.p1  ORF type:complete len:246 (+),score=55.98 TRINITY_DN14752_c1_g2_i1:77-814(+)
MALNPSMTFSMSFRSGDNLLHLRLPVPSKFVPFLIDACASFRQELTQDDADLARRLEEGMDRMVKFHERMIMNSFHDMARDNGALDVVPEGDEEGQVVETDADAELEEGSESRESPPQKREKSPRPQGMETMSKMDLKVQPLPDEADSGLGSEHRQPQSPTELHLQQLSMKPMDFSDIVPSQQHSTSGMKTTPSKTISRMRSLRLPNLRAWRASRSKKISPGESETDSKEQQPGHAEQHKYRQVV